jgi:hypothetical protein
VKKSDLKVGSWYILAGQGPLRLVEPPGVYPGIKFEAPSGGHYWAGLDQVVRPVDHEFLNNYERDAGARGYDVSWVPRVRKEIDG